MYGIQRYLGIEKDFIEAQYYVSFDQDNVYSEFFTREIILLGAEIEAAFKELCIRIDGTKPGNIGDYKYIILSNLPNVVRVDVREKQSGKLIIPFRNWDKSELDWWNVYREIKHNLVDSKATLGVAITMLQAYLILLFCITAMKEDVIFDIVDSPKLFEVGFQAKGAALSSSMQMLTIYNKDSVLKVLGYKEE